MNDIPIFIVMTESKLKRLSSRLAKAKLLRGNKGYLLLLLLQRHF